MADSYLSEEERKATELALEAAKDAHSEKWWQQTWKTPEGEGTELSDLLCFFDDEGKPRFWNWMSVGEFVAHADPSFVLSVLDRLEEALKENEKLRQRIDELGQR